MGLIPCKPGRRELLAHAVLLFFFEFLRVSDLPELKMNCLSPWPASLLLNLEECW